jgi:hypothetical protein
MDSHVGRGARCEAEVVGEAMGGVGSRGFCGVRVSGGGARAVAPATDFGPTEEWFEKEGE